MPGRDDEYPCTIDVPYTTTGFSTPLLRGPRGMILAPRWMPMLMDSNLEESGR